MNRSLILEGAAKAINQPNMHPGTVEVLCGKQVMALLYDNNFLAEWNKLYEECPWATIFQSNTFVKLWYENHEHQHMPILAIARHEDKLTGLLPMCNNVSDLGIAGAGGWDAYYHTWLAHTCNGDIFITAALQAIRNRFPGQDIFLKYIPPQAPRAWIERESKWKERCVIRTFSRPLLNLNAPEVDKLLLNKTLKKICNRLKKLGELRLETVNNLEDFTAVLDTLADQCDFRKAATLNIMPFRDNSSKRPFYVDLFKKGLIITTVLKLNEQIIAGWLTIAGRDAWIYGTVITHAPAFSQYSPGYLIIKMMAMKLKKEGLSFLDLAPGGHGYKEYHANAHDEVFELRVTNKVKTLYMKSFFGFKETVKTFLHKRGVNSRALSQSVVMKFHVAKDQLKASGPIPWFRPFRKPSLGRPDIRVFKLTIAGTLLPSDTQIRKNNLDDLLSYSATGSRVSRWEFMKRSIGYYEAGFIPYTYSEQNQLLCLVWHLKENVVQTESENYPLIPVDAPILKDLYVHPEATNILKAFLHAVTVELSKGDGANAIYLLNASAPPSLQKEVDYVEELK